MPVKPHAAFVGAEDSDTWAIPENGNDPDAIPEMEPMEVTIAEASDFASGAVGCDLFYVKEMKKHVRLRYLNAAEVDRYRQSLIIGKGNNIQINQKGARAKLASMALAREDGSRMFADRDIPEMMKWQSIILERIADRVKRLNGITDEDMGGDDVGN